MSENQPPESAAASAVLAEERRLRPELGFWGLTAIGFSNIVGSGWLFAAMYAAQQAGPASLLSWVGAGLLCALVALVMVELGATRPEGGGTVRWPLYASGRVVGTVIGWSVLLSVGGTAAEITAIMQYAAHYLHGLYHGDTLTLTGLGLAVGLSVVLTVLNWFAVRVFATFNNVVSALKILVPVLTVVALFASGWHAHRLTDHGGFAPYGYAACLSALAGGGIVYSVNGFQAPLDFSGETRRPRRTVPAAVLAGIGLALLVYLALQAAYLFTVPDSLLRHGWSGVTFDSPFGQLALLLNLHWLASLLYADAVLSPGGSAYVGVAIDARHTYALAKNGLLPRFFMRVNPRHGIPHRALLLNFAVILVFLLPFGGWQNIVSVMGDMYLLIYAASAVAVAAFRAHARRTAGGAADGPAGAAPAYPPEDGPVGEPASGESGEPASEESRDGAATDDAADGPADAAGTDAGPAGDGPGGRRTPGGERAGTVPGVSWIAPVSYVVSSEFVYWSGWHDLRLALPLVLAGVLLFLVTRRSNASGPPLAAELRHGAWLVVHLLVLTGLSWLGTFGGAGHLPAPYDSVTVGVVSLAVFAWAVRSSTAHLAISPPPEIGTARDL